MRRRKKKLKTAIYHRLLIPPSCSPLFPRADCRLLLIALLLCLGTAIAVRPASAAEKKSEKPYALIFGTVWSPENHPLYGVKVEISGVRATRSRAGCLFRTTTESSLNGFPQAGPITWYGLTLKAISLATAMVYGRVPRLPSASKTMSEPILVCI